MAGGNLVDKLNLMVGAFGKLSAKNISIGELGSTVGNSLSTLGLIKEKTGSIIGMIAGAIDLLSQIELDDLIGGILENVVQAVGNVFQGIGNIFGIDFGLGSRDNSQEMLDIQNEQKNKLDAINNALNNILDELKGSYGNKALEEYNKALELQKQTEDANKKGLMAALLEK